MANSISHSLAYPVKHSRFSLDIAFNTSAGVPTDPTTPDTEVSFDGGATSADCTEEITTGSTNGVGYITLTGAEMNNTDIAVIAKSANCTTSRAFVRPRDFPIISTGTLSAGNTGGGTLGTVLGYDITGCMIRTTGGTGGGGTGGANNQAREIATYNVSTGVFTILTNWETTVSTDTTYDILMTPLAVAVLTRVLVSVGTGSGQINVASGKVPATFASTDVTGNVAVDLQTIKTQLVSAAAGITFPGGTLASTINITAGTITTATTTTNLTNLPTITANWLTGTGIDSTAVTKLQAISGNSPGAVGGLPLLVQPVAHAVGVPVATIDSAVVTAGATITVPLLVASTTNITAGTITTTTNLTNLPAVTADWLTGTGVAASAVTKIQAGLSTYAGGDTSGTTTLLSRIGGSLTISGGAVLSTLATLQPNYAPSKAGDAMTLDGTYDAAKNAASQTSVTSIATAVTALPGVIWSYAKASVTTAGSIGKYIIDSLASVLSTLSTGSFSVSLVSPVAQTGEITLIHGDDYVATDGRDVSFTITGAPDLTSGTARLVIKAMPSDTVVETVTGTITSPASDPTISFDVLAAVTAALQSDPGYKYALKVTLTSGRIVTLAAGSLTVTD